MTRLTPHFHLAEFTRSATAERLGIDNRPGDLVLANLHRLAERLEALRAQLGGHPVLISSGYRSPALNRAVGGVPNSAHQAGLAADFTVPELGAPLAICHAIAETHLPFDQLIHEYGRWIHLGLRPEDDAERRQLLTIDGQGARAGLLAVRAGVPA